MIERAHQTTANMTRTFELEDACLDEDNPWTGMLTATAFAVRSTCHTALQAAPGQLVFNRDVMFNIKHVANWKAIKEHKQKKIDHNNARENAKRLEHTHHVGEEALVTRDEANELEKLHQGPFKVVEAFTNGTVHVKKGEVIERINTCRTLPFKS